MATRREIALAHYRELLEHHGREIGRRVARKHLGWYLDQAGAGETTRRAVQREDDPGRVVRLLRDAFDRLAEREAA